MTGQAMPICFGCTRKREGLRCDAFPERIPDSIIDSSADHRAPIDGDGGLTFEPRDAERAAYAVELLGPAPGPYAGPATLADLRASLTADFGDPSDGAVRRWLRSQDGRRAPAGLRMEIARAGIDTGEGRR